VKAGSPQSQHFAPIVASTLILAEMFAGGSRKSLADFVPPLNYEPGNGDLIIMAPEIGVPGVVGLLQRSYLSIIFAIEGNIPSLPTAAYLFNRTLDHQTDSNNPICIANIVPGPAADATMVRFHVNHLYTATHDCHWQHMSVGVRDPAAPSSTLAVPVPAPFATQLEWSRYPDTEIWTDWVPLNVPAGAALLFKATIANPSQNNAWSYTMANGFGCYKSPTDSWNNKDMLGTVTTGGPTEMHVIDRAQYR